MKRAFVSLLLLLASTSAFASARIIIKNTNAPGIGFNDNSPAEPVGGNNGTTIGQQRLNVFQRAADIWGALLESPVDIVVDASFANLECTATSAVLGQTRPTTYVRNFEGTPQQDVWYAVGLASTLAKKDLSNNGTHIFMQFTTYDTSNCPFHWYYGFDGNHGDGEDMIVTALHEIAHGLGFSGVTSGTTGKMSSNFPSAFEQHTFDISTGKHFDQMTDAQRLASATNDQNVVWDGAAASAAARKTLQGTPTFKVTSSTGTTSYHINTAQFGGKLTVAGINGTIVAAVDPNDANGASTTDGCSAFTNASAMIGKIALIDRGNCNFTVKAKNAQNAGALAVVIADNVDNSIPPLGGTDATVTIPVIGVTKADGATIRAALSSTVTANMFLDGNVLSGADSSGHPRLYVPASFTGGSSIYHFDTSATPNLLMEPNVSSDLTPTGVDITLDQLLDMGWTKAVAKPTDPIPLPTSPVPAGRRATRRH